MTCRWKIATAADGMRVAPSTMAVEGQGWGDGIDNELDIADAEPLLGWPEVGEGSQASSGRVGGHHDEQDRM